MVSLLAIEMVEEQIEEEQKTNLIEVVLGENGSLGRINHTRCSQVVMLFYMLKALKIEIC